MTKLINAIKNALRFFESKSLYKPLLSFLLIIVLAATTACNGSDVTAKTNLDNPPPGKITSLYKPITPAVGGMNNYSDVDPRVDTSKVEAKANRLIKQAKDLQKKDTNPLQQIKKDFDRKGIQERVEDTANSVSQAAKETVEGVSTGTRKGFENMQENAKSFKDDVDSAADDLGQNARVKATDLKDAVKNGI